MRDETRKALDDMPKIEPKSGRQRSGAWLSEETFALVELATVLGVQLNSKESNAEAIKACTNRAKQLIAAAEELEQKSR